MKHLFVLLAVTAGLTASLSAQSSANSPRIHPVGTGSERARDYAAITRALKHHYSVAFITSYTPTGSHIPQVVIFYKGHFYAANDFSVGNVYSGRDIEASGALDVGSALSALDPAITTSRGGR